MSGNPNKPRVILVLGVHRSGTSATTRVLNLLGAELNAEMLGASFDNPKGFWESIEAVAIHERLFAALSRTWYDMQDFPAHWMSLPSARQALAEITELVRRDFDGKPLCAIKDPRLCLLVPLWLEALASLDIEASALFVVRNPAEVSDSLKVRNSLVHSQWGLGHGPVMWVQYLVEAEMATRGCRRAMLTYDELLTDWRPAMERVGVALDIAWPRPFDDASQEIDAFLDQGDRHHRVQFDAAKAAGIGLPGLVVRLYEECLRITRGKASWDGLMPLSEQFRVASELYSGAIENVLHHFHGMEERVALEHAALAAKENEVAAYQQQAEKYDRLLRAEMSRVQSMAVQVDLAASQNAAYVRELEAYRTQAQTYDNLLREALDRAEQSASGAARHDELTSAPERNGEGASADLATDEKPPESPSKD